LQDLLALPEAGMHQELAPYLEVRVLQDGPEPSLRFQIQTALKNKHVRLSKIDVTYPAGVHAKKILITFDELQHLKPTDLFNNLYKSRFECPPPEEMMKLLNGVIIKVNLYQN